MTTTTYGILADVSGESWAASWDDSGTITAISELPMSYDERAEAARNPDMLKDWYLTDDEETLSWAHEADEAGKLRRVA